GLRPRDARQHLRAGPDLFRKRRRGEVGRVTIRMTLTAPSCPVAGSLPADVERAVRAVPGVTDLQLDLTFDPPWTKDRMSEAAKLALGIEDLIPIARLRP